MRALFLTTETNDTDNHIAAWNSVSDTPAKRWTFSPTKIRNDWQCAEAAQGMDVIFYIGPNEGSGIPKPATLKQLRDIAPLINFCSDAGDFPWHAVLDDYRARECFDLQVGIDGCPDAPVDLATLTPVDWRAFNGSAIRDIHCGFSGNTTGIRSGMLGYLGSKVTVRCRGNDYPDHIGFIKRCKLLFNVSFTGSGRSHHIKGRAVEAGWAGCALLESVDSPLWNWYPKDAYLAYETIEDAKRIIETTPDDVIENTALVLSKLVREKYNPAKIYGEILERVNLDNTLTFTAF